MSVEIQFAARPINIELLAQELKTTIGANKVAGVSFRDGAIYVVFVDRAGDDDILQAGIVLNAHNPNSYTPEQQTTISAFNDRTALKSAANAILAQINDDIAALPVGNLASANVILSHTLNNLERVVRYLRWTI